MKIPYAENIPVPRALLTRGWLIFPILSAVFALGQAGKNVAARFLLACFLLGLLAWLPITGWIIGYFLSAWMLERAVWLFPFGLSSVYTIVVIKDYIKIKNPLKSISADWLLFLVATFALGIFSLYMVENGLPDFERFAKKTQRYQGFAAAGQELDLRISDFAHVVGSPQLNDLIPGISAKSKLITFRISNPSHMQYYSAAQRAEKISDTNGIFSKSLSPGDKMLLLEKYNIRFLFLQSFDLRLFTDFIAEYPDRVQETEIGGVVILQIND